MKQTIEVEVPDGHKAVYNEETQRIIIRKIEKPKVELPKSWEEFCKNNPVKKNEYFINGNGEIICAAEKYRTANLKNILPNKETAEAFLALMQLIQLRDCYRQGWKPDWKDNTIKHCIICLGGVIDKDWNMEHWNNGEQRILSFQTAEIRDNFMCNFYDLIGKAKELI